MLKLQRSHDFERVLRTRSAVSGPHFALHHLHAEPSRPPRRGPRPPIASADPARLSTPGVATPWVLVDEAPAVPGGVWFGAVVPKRHARRAVTRTLLKRQIRAVASRHAGGLPQGLWVVRLRAPFDRARFTSAASEPLKAAARTELDALFCRAAARR